MEITNQVPAALVADATIAVFLDRLPLAIRTDVRRSYRDTRKHTDRITARRQSAEMLAGGTLGVLARTAIAETSRTAVETFLSAQWSVIAGAADVAARTYRLRSMGLASEEVAQEVALRIGIEIMSGAPLPTSARIGRMAHRVADQMREAAGRAPVGAMADAGDTAARVDGQISAQDNGERQHAAVTGRKARFSAPRRSDVWGVAEDSRRTMRAAADVSAVTHRQALLAEAMARPWWPVRPAESAAWQAMLDSAVLADAEMVGPMDGYGEPKDVAPAGSGPVVAWHAERPISVVTERPAPATREQRAAARSEARRLRSDAEYAAFLAANAGTAETSAAAEEAKRLAEESAHSHHAMVESLGRTRSVITTEYRATEHAVPAADSAPDILLSAYVPESLYVVRGPVLDTPIMVKQGAVVSAEATGSFRHFAHRDRAPIGALLADGGKKKAQRHISPAAILSTDVHTRAAQSALGRAAKSWAAEVLASVKATEQAESDAIRNAAAARQAAEDMARCGPRTYHWVKRSVTPVYTGPRTVGAGYGERADSERSAIADMPNPYLLGHTYAEGWKADEAARAMAVRASERAERIRLTEQGKRSPASRLALAAEEGPAEYLAAYLAELPGMRAARSLLVTMRTAFLTP